MSKIVLLFLFFLMSCGHHKDVRPGEDVHRVVVRAEDKSSGERDAIEQANHYCKQFKRTARFIKEEAKYTGTVNESTYNTTKMVTKGAMAAGGAAWVMGGKKESTAGGIASVGGGAVNAALGDGYTIEMLFKCD